MNFELSEPQRSWQARARAVGQGLAEDAGAVQAIAAAASDGLLDPVPDLLTAVVAVDALAHERPAPAIALAIHTGVVLGLSQSGEAAGPVRDIVSALRSGGRVGAAALSSEDVPVAADGRLTGRASWSAPLTPEGVVVVGAARPQAGGREAGTLACGAWLSDPGVTVDTVATAGLRGVPCGHVRFDGVRCVELGSPVPLMIAIRILLAAAGLGMGRRALRVALQAARRYERTGPGGEQTVQGLLADTATELDAAMLLTWKAASAGVLSLAEASMAKLAATEATQRAVARATQVAGGDSFLEGHVIARLAQDVRALELFAGRTEALREAVALETLPVEP